MTHRPKTRQAANLFGALGYISCLIQWMLVFVIFILPTLDSDGFRGFFIPPETAPSQPTSTIALPPFLQSVLLIAAILFSLGIMIYAIISVPRAIGRTGGKVTHKAADVAVTHIVHRKHLTVKQQKTFIEHITWSIKLILTILPLLLLLLPSTATYTIPKEYILLFGAFCAGMTLLWFGIQYTIARISKLDSRIVW